MDRLFASDGTIRIRAAFEHLSGVVGVVGDVGVAALGVDVAVGDGCSSMSQLLQLQLLLRTGRIGQKK